MKKVMNKKSGFTLIELMIVVIIVGVLAAVAVPMMNNSKTKAQATEAKSVCASIKTALSCVQVEHDVATVAAVTGVSGLSQYMSTADADGTYYQNGNYGIAATDAKNFVVTVAAGSDGAPTFTYTVANGVVTTTL